MALPAPPSSSPATVTLLFCHGGGFCRDIWAPIVSRLRRSPLLRRHAAAGGHVRVTTFDLPYHGANRDVSVAPQLTSSTTTDVPRVTHPAMHWPAWSTAAVLREVRQLQQQQNEHDCVIIGVGHSLGAAAMWSVEASYPGTFVGLVLFEPICLLNQFPAADAMADMLIVPILKRRATWKSLAAAETDLRATRRFSRWHNESFQTYIQGALVSVATIADEDVDAGVTLACPPLIEAALYSGDILRLSARDVARVRCRVTFHYGARTSLFFPELRQHLVDQYPRRYRIGEPVPRATHELVVEDPDTVTSRIVESLAELPLFEEDVTNSRL